MTKQAVLDPAEETQTWMPEADLVAVAPTTAAHKHERLIVNCDGGLGNQMFEYAAGVYFARAFSRELEVLKPIAKQQQWNGYERPFQLSEFRITAPVREADGIDRMMVSRSAKLKQLRKLLRPLFRAEALEEPQAYSWQPGRVSAPTQRDAYLVGYWQAAAYVEAVGAQLRQEFTLKRPLRKHNQDYAADITRLARPVSLHVRLGDYTMIQHAVGNGKTTSQVLPLKYYENALRALEDAIGTSYTLIVFSDDVAKARELLGDLAECVFVEGNGADTAHEEMMLMSLCSHHIIANSSFSWWGAWLNGKPGKRVFAPRFWGNTPTSHFPDLYPPGWDIVENL